MDNARPVKRPESPVRLTPEKTGNPWDDYWEQRLRRSTAATQKSRPEPPEDAQKK